VTADVRDQVKLSAKRGDITRERLDGRDFTVLDLGDPARGDTHDLSEPLRVTGGVQAAIDSASDYAFSLWQTGPA